MKLQLLYAVCLFNIYAECHDITKNNNSSRDFPAMRSQYWYKIRKMNEYRDPPDHTKIIAMSRYVLHNTIWCSIATISTLPGIQGFPFTNVKSFVDGSLAVSTGVPYFYMAPADFTAKDLSKNSRTTVLVSLEETGYCSKQQYDPQDPRCTRLMLSGKMKRVTAGSSEYSFAKAALFERHPDMANYPADHNWFIAKMKIFKVSMVDWFGGAKNIPVKDYLAYNYTGREIYNYYYSPKDDNLHSNEVYLTEPNSEVVHKN
ncbi:protein CREG1 [Hyposmocoma kahamanoa]|uniref:protein CREG1 n=1 Tax=Hyposmocoma kahamanoa TaxID=1477025 RepID=UPI000E6D6520|nr:protein CREG1 [Hyposmocoma kahamanoa]